VLALLVTLVPILVYALALAFRIDRLRFARLLGLLLGFAGVLLVIVPRTSLPEPEMVGWVALGLVVPLCYAVNAVLIALMSPPATGALPLGFGLLFFAAIYAGVAMIVTGEYWAFPAPFSDADWATIAAMANNALTYVLIFVIIHRAGPVVFSTCNYIATLAGIGFGIWLFGDRPSVWIWAALVLMCVGLFLVNFSGVSLRRKAA
jgi:drug/metabolite transporter (DMT)-like permease